MTDQGPRRGARGGFPVGLTFAVALAMAILLGLGVWQLQRLKWKEGLLANVAALQAAKPVALGSVLDGLARGRDVDFTRVSIVCPGIGQAPYLELYALRRGQTGVRLISACETASAPYRTILVDRGFIPDTSLARPPVDPAARAPVEVIGVVRRPDRPSFVSPKNQPDQWFTRDVAAMAQALKAPDPAPVFLFAETTINPELKALVPAPLPADIPNRHLEYALTWFGLAATLLGVYAAVLLRRARA